MTGLELQANQIPGEVALWMVEMTGVDTGEAV